MFSNQPREAQKTVAFGKWLLNTGVKQNCLLQVAAQQKWLLIELGAACQNYEILFKLNYFAYNADRRYM